MADNIDIITRENDQFFSEVGLRARNGNQDYLIQIDFLEGGPFGDIHIGEDGWYPITNNVDEVPVNPGDAHIIIRLFDEMIRLIQERNEDVLLRNQHLAFVTRRRDEYEMRMNNTAGRSTRVV